ncbi:hypothetical protein P170DRAFT_377518 [Aspergillus steynii IBT 23096]|uniref:Uncharacterized protein n=1 Tax=Aspergillus steynii IBT 23096 TaxID=1392250 RepID=A0A2I2GGP7_9EURO|nr:uncharacterized protein P170DRAFT_377518 [Aspergillus steynii IBT 23096]PLB52053.1 hypothetical protein P170DRAFT_377518 [Aspergillus steynii IBT 23096]
MDSIIRFIPTDAEQQHPLAREYICSAATVATPDPQSTQNSHGQSGSNWGIEEVNAVRAIPIVNVDPKRIVPEEYFPRSDNQHFAKLRRAIREADIDALKTYSTESFKGNPYKLLFEDLSELITTYTSEESIGNAHRRQTSTSSVETDLSTSSNEGKGEAVSVTALRNFIKATLPSMRGLAKLPIQGPVKPSLMCYSNANRFEWMLAGVKYVAINDGSVGVNFRGYFSGSNRFPMIPVAGLECKPRHAGGIKRGSGEPKNFILEIFAQEVAQLLGNMIAQRSELKNLGGRRSLLRDQHEDQEAFVLSMHGTLFYVSTAYFSPEYIQYIEGNELTELSVDNIFLWVKQSVHFDLKDIDQRVKALEFLWALLGYIASGEAKMNNVTAAITAMHG